MAITNFRPKYVSFDCYGTLINWILIPLPVRLLAGRLPEEQWPPFKKVFRGTASTRSAATTSPTSRSFRIHLTGCATGGVLGQPKGPAQSSLRLYTAGGPHEDVPAPL
jgi:2-haloacid dehalogenase